MWRMPAYSADQGLKVTLYQNLFVSVECYVRYNWATI